MCADHMTFDIFTDTRAESLFCQWWLRKGLTVEPYKYILEWTESLSRGQSAFRRENRELGYTKTDELGIDEKPACGDLLETEYSDEALGERWLCVAREL